MSELPRNLVVRTHAPARRRLTIGAIVVLSMVGLYLAYELGRYDGGYDRLAAMQERREHEVALEQLEKANRELRTRLAELDTIRIGRNRERAELARTIGDLQAQVAKQSQELEFYRGIVAQGANAFGVKIQQLRIVGTDQPDRFRVRMTVVQSGRPDEVVNGTVSLKVEGESEGRPASLEFPALTDGKIKEERFSFRYFENFDQEITIPTGFRAERLTVELRSNRKGVAPVTQSFLWRVDAP